MSLAAPATMTNRPSIWHYAPIAIVAALCIAATLAVWSLMQASEHVARDQEFNTRATNQANIIQNQVDDHWLKLFALRALFESAERPITRDEFEQFAKSLIADDPAILNVAWVPRVKRDERAAHELAAARDGFPDYHIRTVVRTDSSDNKLVIAPEQDEYFPKFYSTEARNSPVYGLDLREGGIRDPILNRIRDENALVSSPPLVLQIGEGDRNGFWVGLPVYRRNQPHGSVEDRRRNMAGLVQAVFQIRVLIDSTIAGVRTPVRIYLFAPDAGENTPSLYAASRLKQELIAPRSKRELFAGLHVSFPLQIGDVPWQLVITPESIGLITDNHESSSILLICGLLLSGLLTSYVWAARNHARKLEAVNDQIAKQNLRFDAAVNNMAQGLLMYDQAGRLVISNRRFAELFKIPWKEWETGSTGKTIAESMELTYKLTNVTEKDPAKIFDEVGNILRSGEPGKLIVERTDGCTFSVACAPMRDGGLVATFDDVTEQRRSQQKISHMARYDSLTDLPNRVLFYEQMEKILAKKHSNRSFAILSLDLDHFKSVNDTLGHPVGDRLLQQAAERMRNCMRERDVVARLGGDEFAVVQISFEKPADATALAKRLIDTISAPYQIDDRQVIIGTSIGIAVSPGDGTEPDQLMKNADLALYRCKADGGNTYRFFEPHMDARMQERRALELDLRKALVRGEFTLDYQPIVNLKTGKIATCEALIRWHHPERGLVSPLEFISIAEETGLIVPIGEWVLRQACADAVEWPGNFSVAVNVSPAQFKSANLLNAVTSALEAAHLPANRLELEITELVLMQDNSAVLDILHHLKALGVSIAMDDFGTGYSSLSYLRSFPFDKIKIDQSFVQDLSKNKDSLAILRAVVGIGRSLGIVTTAEGIETQNQIEILRSEGCTEAQGFFFSRPASATAIREFLASLKSDLKAIA